MHKRAQCLVQEKVHGGDAMNYSVPGETNPSDATATDGVRGLEVGLRLNGGRVANKDQVGSQRSGQ